MESAEDLDEAKQLPNPIATREHAAGAEDLISGLCDDVLLRILGLVAEDDARDAAPTGELSRRWRGLWKRVPALCFKSAPWSQRYAWSAERCIAFIDDMLAFRAQSGSSAQHLRILFELDDREQAAPPIIAAAERWIWYAMQHRVRSFSLGLVLAPDEGRSYHRDTDVDDGEEEHEGEVSPVIALDELPGSAMLETMCLELDYANRVRLPTTAVFASLVDLTLESIVIEGDSGHLLARLVSSACCPLLEKLSLKDVKHDGVKELLIEAGKLSDLSLTLMHEMRSLKLVTPSLRVLRIEWCHGIEKLRVSAPRLDKLITCMYKPLSIDIDGDFLSVSSLKLNLWSHDCSGDDCNNNNFSICLLQRCRLATRLEVCLHVPSQGKSSNADIIKDRLPQLPQVIYLKLCVSPGWKWHLFGDCLANFLATFSNLRYLYLDFSKGRFSQLPSLRWFSFLESSDSACNHWKSHEFSSAYLVEVEFKGVKGTDCELQFLQFVVGGATLLRKVVLCFKRQNEQLEDFPQRLLGHGIWTHKSGGCQSFEWRPC